MVRRPGRTLLFSPRGAVAALLALSLTALAVTCEPIPERVPAKHASRAEVIEQLAEAARSIPDPERRWVTVCGALYHARKVPADELEPLLEIARETAPLIVDDKTLFQSLESLSVAPELAEQIAQRIQDPKWRARGLIRDIAQLSNGDPARARELCDQLQDPVQRCEAMLRAAAWGKFDFDTTVQLLRAGRRLYPAESGPPSLGTIASYFSMALTRFARTESAQVCALVTEELNVDDGYACLNHIAWQLLYAENDSRGAEAVLEACAELAPNASIPHDAAARLIEAGYGQLCPEKALALFDAHALPRLKHGDVQSDAALASLATIDVDLLVERATEVADALKFKSAAVAAKAIERAAGHADTAQAIVDWLAERPPGPVRDAALPRVVLSFAFTIDDERLSAEETNRRIAVLWAAIQAIQDPQTQWDACRHLQYLVTTRELGSPPGLTERCRALAREHPELIDQLFRNDYLLPSDYALLPDETQRDRIRTALPDARRRDEVLQACDWIHRASLPDAERRTYFEALLKVARQDRMQLAYVAQRATSIDWLWALDLMWQALPEARLPDSQLTCMLGPPENARAAIELLLPGNFWSSEQRPLDDAQLAVVWDYVRLLPAADRDAAIDGLAGSLVRIQDVRRHIGLSGPQYNSQALGIAQHIEDPARRAALLSQILASMSPEAQASSDNE